jgi:catechol 2,3-dioxygenase-like lactoylglutathione lyase family enzyme
MEVNGIAHIFLTASNYERSREFYRKLLPFLGLKPVIDTEATYYCVGGRTAVGISAPSAEHEGAAFEQKACRFASSLLPRPRACRCR